MAALKALILRRKIDQKQKALDALRAKDADFEKREAEIAAAAEEAETEEDMTAVEESADALEAELSAHAEAKGQLEREIGELEDQLEAEEAEQDTTPEPQGREAAPAENITTREENLTMQKAFRNMTPEQRAAFVAREDVKAYLAEIRAHMEEHRALNNAGLTIPRVMLGLLRENVLEYSKLYKHCDVRALGGEGRLVISGTVPEAVWTECCKVLNELDLTFNDVEVGCNKIGGYFAVCNAILEDSDIDLAAYLLDALGQAIGLALDKAILYGTGTKMPLGVVTRLAQTAAPDDYPATARPWADLHTSNIKSITAANSEGVKLFQNIITGSGAAKGKYSRGAKTWVMNEATYTELIAQATAVNASGAIVAGVNGVMPVIGGDIEVLSFIPDNVIIGGYFDLYLLAERAGEKFAQSEHVRFIQDQTVLKGTARYDGTPEIAEAFVAIGIKGTTPTAAMTFAPDTANA